MRIDVDFEHRDVESELAALWERLRKRGDVLQQLPIFAPRAPELVFRYREVDGEFHVYAEDPGRGLLAGCTVFNRVPDLDAQVGRYLRSPHSRYASAHRRRGVASAVYQWALQAGMGLVSGPRQSQGAHMLWEKLAESYELVFVHVEGRNMKVLDTAEKPSALDALGTRMMLTAPCRHEPPTHPGRSSLMHVASARGLASRRRRL